MPPRSYREVVPFRIREDLNRAGDIKNLNRLRPDDHEFAPSSHTKPYRNTAFSHSHVTEQTSGNRHLQFVPECSNQNPIGSEPSFGVRNCRIPVLARAPQNA